MLLKINQLYFSYTPNKPLFENFNYEIESGKIIALAGESGCGKSTLLSLIYGLYDWENGEIFLEDQKLFGPKKNLVPGEKEMKFVAQNYDLMPYSTVYDNVGKFISNINLALKREKVLELLTIVGLEDYADEFPKNLSGGQQQRVAIARALSVKPKLLLLDEPFSNLDYSRKIILREKLFNYVKKENISLLISTHEIQEIMPWLDQITVIKDGKLIQNDSPKNMYQNPKSEYVARLMGEVNVWTEDERVEFGLEKKFYFPEEIQVYEEGLDALVIESRFAGSHYWNKLLCKGKTIVSYSTNSIEGKIRITIR
ncbi:sulfate/molybdate ABC transporter ATP-binding protein [Amniculibacterium sp. G2-70]|uniref:sulfate/molybdate ABC transporter ATP-binding protein n=1 Tax=Amniculibacterium sp. G2-70 TaxID=2767188 RepID=UPI00165415A6|nr:ABC transporter ATP-binding protein [Amniculibacterium sp. G2-70]